MNRRGFLKVSGLASLFLLAVTSPLTRKVMGAQPHGVSAGKLYRGTQDGKIYKSEDQGQTWMLHSNFGDQYAILGFSEKRSGNLYAHVSYQFRDFDLQLANNEKYWINVL